MRRLSVGVVALLLAAPAIMAQNSTPPVTTNWTTGRAATGAVTGHVLLDDTKGPARNATVNLQPAADLEADTPIGQSAGQQSGGVTIGVQARLDGSFVFSHVAPGSYYVIASCPGYISPYTLLSLAEARSPYETREPLESSYAAARKQVLAGLPRVTVQPGPPATIDVTLERGAAISGTVPYDDGSPASGLRVSALARMTENGKQTWAEFSTRPQGQCDMVYTDDRGNYRISGLPARGYLVQVDVSLPTRTTYYSNGSGESISGGRSDLLSLYSGSTPRKENATAVTLQGGEERDGEDFRIPIGKLHTITGSILSAHDGHVVNSGQVALLDARDGSYAGTADVSADSPTFTLNFIYDGDYILTSPVSADAD